MTSVPGKWVDVAAVARPHGVRGEVRVKPYADDSEFLLGVKCVCLRSQAGAERPATVVRARPVPGAILMTFDGVGDRDAALVLGGAVVCVRREDLAPLGDGEFYACDVEGADVVCGERRIGLVTALQSYPSADVLVVVGERRWEIPLTRAFVAKVDIEAGRVELCTLEGLEPEDE